MDTPTSSRVGNVQVGRIIVLIPDLDFGIIEKVSEGAVTPEGNPASTQLEIESVKRAAELLKSKGLKDYVILTDNEAAARFSGVERAKWLEAGRKHLASLYLQRIIDRARYLRESDRKTINRAPPNRLQDELFKKFNADRIEFKLSESLLWGRIQSQMEA